jgi:hypothetical protein
MKAGASTTYTTLPIASLRGVRSTTWQSIGIVKNVDFVPLKQKVCNLKFKVLKRNTSCCLIAHFVHNEWIATSVASLLPRNDERGWITTLTLAMTENGDWISTPNLTRTDKILLSKP